MEGSPELKRARLDAAASTVEGAAGDDAKSRLSSADIQSMMKPYYGKLFPHSIFYKWLAYGNDSKHPQADASFFHRREFCFTMAGDIFIRYQSFKDGEDLQRAICAKVPSKIDIGPVYNVDPARRHAYTGLGSERSFAPVERELVFDIDLTDYDDVRTCGKEGHICKLCWPLMAIAIEVIDAGLRQDFGFQHILWVFSGRRGIHCWVCDARARALGDEARAAVAGYFMLFRGERGGLARIALSHISQSNHPAVDRAYTLLQRAWTQHILPQQQLLEDEAGCEGVLAYVEAADPGLAAEVRARWRGRSSGVGLSLERWRLLDHELSKAEKSHSGPNKYKVQRLRKEIIFAYTYPRLDVEVSKKMNHLLKAPFCVHPKTGKVCVPLDPASAWEFDPEACMTLPQLLDELQTEQQEAEAPGGLESWQSTSMSDAVKEVLQTGPSADAHQRY